MRLTLKAKVLLMIITILLMVAVYFSLISWRTSMAINYNGMPGGEALVPLAVLFAINIK